MGTRSGVSYVGSKEGGSKDKECDVGLGLRMQSKESSHHEASHELLSSSSCSSGDGGGGSGPMFYGRSNPVACVGDIYDAVVGGGGSTASGGVTDAVSVAAGSKSLHPFNNSSFNFNPSGGGEMAPSMKGGVPFTAAQWQELERQAMIYKYMIASVPVPPELLIPINKTQSNTPPPQSHVVKGSLELGISSCNSDPEPWRCKRTDGKKWRCSRDVAPDQKYCERHSHKSRPRSRKPVELHTDSMANTATNSYATNHTRLLNQKSHFLSQTNSHLSMFPSAMLSAANSSFDQSRSLEWFLKGETVPATSNSNQEWRLLKGENMKGGEKLYDLEHRYRGGQIDSNSYMNLRGSHSLSLQAHQLNDNCSLLLSPKSTSMEPTLQTQQQQEAQETRHFLDVWSSAVRESSSGGIGNKGCVSSNEKLLPISSLTLTMSGGSETNEENASEGPAGGLRPQWMMSQGSWIDSPPGGPLAEALCLGISNNANADSNLASSYGYGTSTGVNNES